MIYITYCTPNTPLLSSILHKYEQNITSKSSPRLTDATKWAIVLSQDTAAEYFMGEDMLLWKVDFDLSNCFTISNFDLSGAPAGAGRSLFCKKAPQKTFQKGARREVSHFRQYHARVILPTPREKEGQTENAFSV